MQPKNKEKFNATEKRLRGLTPHPAQSLQQEILARTAPLLLGRALREETFRGRGLRRVSLCAVLLRGRWRNGVVSTGLSLMVGIGIGVVATLYFTEENRESPPPVTTAATADRSEMFVEVSPQTVETSTKMVPASPTPALPFTSGPFTSGPFAAGAPSPQRFGGGMFRERSMGSGAFFPTPQDLDRWLDRQASRARAAADGPREISRLSVRTEPFDPASFQKYRALQQELL